MIELHTWRLCRNFTMNCNGRMMMSEACSYFDSESLPVMARRAVTSAVNVSVRLLVVT